MICNTLQFLYMKEIGKIQNGPKIEGRQLNPVP
jgi:hypothetical protein